MRRGHVKYVIAIVAISVGLGKATGQDTPIGTHLPGDERIKLEHDRLHAAQQAHVFSSCTVHKRASLVRQYLDSIDPAAVERDAKLLARELGCVSFTATSESMLGVSMSSPTDIYRGNLAEALLDRMKPMPTLPAKPLARQYQVPFLAVSGRHPAVEEMAVCVAEIDPQGIATLLSTEPETAAEMSQIQQLLPSVKQCLVATARLSANRESMRAALAEALYHRVNRAAAGADDIAAPTSAPRN